MNQSVSQRLDVAADARWIGPPSQDHPLGVSGVRTFETVGKAARFIMVELDPKFRASAWITTDGESYSIDDVELIHNNIEPPVKAARVQTGKPTPR